MDSPLGVQDPESLRPQASGAPAPATLRGCAATDASPAGVPLAATDNLSAAPESNKRKSDEECAAGPLKAPRLESDSPSYQQLLSGYQEQEKKVKQMQEV